MQKPKRIESVTPFGAMKHWLWTNGPVPRGSQGITLGRLVIVRAENLTPSQFDELLRHEQVHVRQFDELGFLGFLRRYLTSYVRFRLRGYNHQQSYVRIPFEVEARVDAMQVTAAAPMVPAEVVTTAA